MRYVVILIAVASILISQHTVLAEDQSPEAKWTDFFVGNWDRATTITLDGKTEESNTQWSCKAIGGAITADGTTGSGGKYVSMIGWDGFHNCLHEFGKDSDGVSWQIHFKPNDFMSLAGEATVAMKDGRTGKGNCTITRTGPDSYGAEFKATLNDGSTLAVTDDNKRKKAPEPPKNSEHLNRMKYFIGSWKAKAEDGGTTTWTFTWGRNKNFIENEIVEKDSVGKLKLANKGMLSWDNNAKRIINRCLDEAGNPQNFYWRQENDEAWTTWRIGAKNEWPVVIIDENTWRMGNEKQRQVFTRE